MVFEDNEAADTAAKIVEMSGVIQTKLPYTGYVRIN